MSRKISFSYNGLIDRSMLLNDFPNHKRFNDKVSDLIENGHLIKLQRGKYVSKQSLDEGSLSKFLVANSLFGPSYISNYSAMSFHGLIPERVDQIESVTILRSKTIPTPIGSFKYSKVSESTFAFGIDYIKNGNTAFLIASPTKALIDYLWTSKIVGIYGQRSLEYLLIENMRIDEQVLMELEIDLIEKCLEFGKRKRLLNYLLNLVQKYQNGITR